MSTDRSLNLEKRSIYLPRREEDRGPKASALSDDRVVFDVKGNRYRMLTQISFDFGRIAVLRIGTHADYDEWDL